MTKPASPSSALTSPADIAKLSFEDAMSELEKLVGQLEDGKAKLDDAMSAYERGMHLKRHCETKLREAQARIEQIAVSADDKISTTPFNT
jgi:exodeoxyribonuclease VII small subunit